MGKIHSVQIPADDCMKEISVFCDDITMFPYPIDVMTTSAYVGSYAPTPHTLFRALYDMGVSVERLAKAPEFDLRDPCHVWLSGEVPFNRTSIRRIGCVELLGRHLTGKGEYEREQTMINSIRAYFHMLDIASVYGVPMETVSLPLLGAGSQRLAGDLLLIPLINECIAFLKRNHSAKNIWFIERNPEKAQLIANSLKNSLRFSETAGQEEDKAKKKDIAFISYSSKDKNIADNLCAKLEQNGIKVWYAPRDVKGTYAEAITKAIDSARYFVVILSQNSVMSEHVLNEIDLAFQNISEGIKFKPLRIDNAMFTPSFKYYLSRQHWMDATVPPLEERLREFVADLLDD